MMEINGITFIISRFQSQNKNRSPKSRSYLFRSHSYNLIYFFMTRLVISIFMAESIIINLIEPQRSCDTYCLQRIHTPSVIGHLFAENAAEVAACHCRLHWIFHPSNFLYLTPKKHTLFAFEYGMLLLRIRCANATHHNASVCVCTALKCISNITIAHERECSARAKKKQNKKLLSYFSSSVAFSRVILRSSLRSNEFHIRQLTERRCRVNFQVK